MCLPALCKAHDNLYSLTRMTARSLPTMLDLSENYNSTLTNLNDFLSGCALIHGKFTGNRDSANKHFDFHLLLDAKHLLNQCIRHRSYANAKIFLNKFLSNKPCNWIATDVSYEVMELSVSLRIEAIQVLNRPGFDFLTSIDALSIVNALDSICQAPEKAIEQRFLQQETFLQPAPCQPKALLETPYNYIFCLEMASRFHAIFCTGERVGRRHHCAKVQHESDPLNFNAFLLLTSWLYRDSLGSSKDVASMVVARSVRRDRVLDTYVGWATLLGRIGGSFPPVLLRSTLKVKSPAGQTCWCSEVNPRENYFNKFNLTHRQGNFKVSKLFIHVNQLRLRAPLAGEMDSRQHVEDLLGDTFKVLSYVSRIIGSVFGQNDW